MARFRNSRLVSPLFVRPTEGRTLLPNWDCPAEIGMVGSCFAGGKFYAADMELYKDIIRDQSECTVKNGEAVITIQKSKAEVWNKLLKYKHPNVTFDFDHLEDSEDNDGLRSSCSTSKKFYNVVSEDLVSSDYSESESD